MSEPTETPKAYADLIAEARETSGLIVGELLQALEETLARVVELEDEQQQESAGLLKRFTQMRKAVEASDARVVELEKEKRLLREECAGLLASACARPSKCTR